MKRPEVLLDCDGVLADFIGGALDVVRFVTDRHYAHTDVAQFDFCAALGLAPQEASAVKRGIAGRLGFCSDLAVLHGAREGVAALREVAEVYVVTSPWNSCPTWTSEREAWLKRHFGIPHSHVIHASAKHLVRGDMFVDDKVSAVDAWAQRWPDGKAVHWQTPHNQSERTTHATPTRDWADVLRWAVQS